MILFDDFSVNATMEFIRHYHNSCQGDVFSVMEVRIVLQDVFFGSSFVCLCGLQELWVIWAHRVARPLYAFACCNV